MSAVAAAETLRSLMLAHPEFLRNDRWRTRFASIGELAASAARKFHDPDGHGRALARLAGQMLREGRPSDEVRVAVLAEAAARGIDFTRAKGIARWVAERDIERREASHA